MQATAGSMTTLRDTVASQQPLLSSQQEAASNQLSALDAQGQTLDTQAELLAALEAPLALTEEGLSLVHSTVENVNHCMIFSDGLVIEWSNDKAYSRYDADGVTIIHKKVEVAAFSSDSASVQNLLRSAPWRMAS